MVTPPRPRLWVDPVDGKVYITRDYLIAADGQVVPTPHGHRFDVTEDFLACARDLELMRPDGTAP